MDYSAYLASCSEGESEGEEGVVRERINKYKVSSGWSLSSWLRSHDTGTPEQCQPIIK